MNEKFASYVLYNADMCVDKYLYVYYNKKSEFVCVSSHRHEFSNYKVILYTK